MQNARVFGLSKASGIDIVKNHKSKPWS